MKKCHNSHARTEECAWSAKRKRNSVFTLIELLVVFGIIAILASILLPALNAARKKAKSIICVNNLKQIGICTELYKEDYGYYVPMYAYSSDGVTVNGNRHRETFPYFLVPYFSNYTIITSSDKLGIYSNSKWIGWWSARKVLHPEMAGYHLFYCPAATLYKASDNPSPLTNDAWTLNQDEVIATYGKSSSLGYDVSDTDDWFRPKRWLTYPEKSFIYMDGYKEPRIDYSFRRFKARHNNRVNIIMGDNHVEDMGYVEVDYNLINNRVFHCYDSTQWRYAK